MTTTEETKVIHLGNEDQFAEITSAGVTVVDFYADWCGPCKMLGPIMDELSQDFDGKATIMKVDVDEFGSIAGEYGVTSIPMVAVFKDGNMVGDAIVGAHPKETYEEIVNGLLETSEE